MSILISAEDGNFTDASTWQVVDPTSYAQTESFSLTLSTIFSNSVAFTPGAITIDGIAIKLQWRATTPSGTMTVELQQAGSTVSGTSMTVNVADIPLCTSAENAAGGWLFFKFASPVTLAAATAYTVAAKASAFNQVSIYRGSITTGDIARCLRTTTAQAPVAGDDLIIAGEITGPGAKVTRTVTMNSTTNTDYGSNTTSRATPALAICDGGILSFGTETATDYILRLSGYLMVYTGGTLNIGTVESPIPRNSTAWLEFDCTSARGFGLVVRNLGTLNWQGQSRTAGNNEYMCYLAENAAANDTTLTVDRETGWLNGDTIAIASSAKGLSNVASQSESGTLNGDATSTTLTVDGFAGTGGGLKNAHLGSATQVLKSEVVLLTRNTGMRAVDTANYSFMEIRETATVDIDWAWFYDLGNPGFAVYTTTGVFSMRYCSISSFVGSGIVFTGTSSNNYEVRDFVSYMVPRATAFAATIQNAVTSGTDWTIADIYIVYPLTATNANYAGLFLYDLGGVLSGVLSVSAAGRAGIYFNSDTNAVYDFDVTIMGHSHENGSSLELEGFNGRIENVISWHTSGTAVLIDQTTAFPIRLQIGSLTAIGSTALYWSGASVEIDSIFAASSTSYTTSAFISLSANGGGPLKINGGQIGVASGDYTAYTTSSLFQFGNFCWYNDFILNNVTVNGTVISKGNRQRLGQGFGIRLTRNGTNGHKSYLRNGTTERDDTVYATAAPSEKCSPDVQLTAETLESSPFFAAVGDGQTKTVTVKVRKDSSYVGSFEPRLVLKANGSMGQDSTQVMDTLSVGADTWETLSAPLPEALQDGVFELCVEGTGTAGAFWVDDWAVTNSTP